MKIGGTIAFWVKVGLILAVGASVLYLWKKAKGLIPSKEQIQQTLETFVPSLSLPLATPAQQAAAMNISMWQATPFVGPLAGWLANRYYQWNPPYETLPEGSSNDVGVSTPRDTVITEIPETREEIYDYLQRYPG